MKALFTLIAISTSIVTSESFALKAQIVWSETGQIFEGTVLPASKSRAVEAFLGIPYAQPPIGNLRFRPPRSVKLQNETLTFDRRQKNCWQITQEESNFDEDCLYLNVYKPAANKIKTNEKLSTLIWLHQNDPRELVAEGGIIVVTVQHRMNSFGYLYSDSSSGNVGLLDQRAAINWVKDHISDFGGDPYKITIGGHGPGAVSALTLQQSNRVILHSAALDHPWSHVNPEEAEQRSLDLAESLNCTEEDLVSCMRRPNISAKDIFEAEKRLLEKYRRTKDPKIKFLFAPIENAENRRKIEENILKNSKHLGILIGSNLNEGSEDLDLAFPKMFTDEIVEEYMTSEVFESVIDKLFQSENNRVKSAVKFQYTYWENPGDNLSRFQAIVNVLTESQYVCPIDGLVDGLADKASVYRFRLESRLPENSLESEGKNWLGVRSDSDLDYLFGRPISRPSLFGQRDIELSRFIIKSWANFVKTGNPNDSSLRSRSVQIGWPRYFSSKGRRHVAVLTSESPDVLIGINGQEENCAFWNELIPVLKDSKEETKEEVVIEKPLAHEKTQSLVVHGDELESLVIDDLNRAATLFEPINSLRSQALLSAVDTGFKVVGVEDDERERRDFNEETATSKSKPDDAELAFKFSVGGGGNGAQSELDQSPDSEEWTLFRPRKPGNSPIYIAKDAQIAGGDESGTTMPDAQDGQRDYYSKPSTVFPSLSERRPRPQPVLNRAPLIYDPFNPESYKHITTS